MEDHCSRWNCQKSYQLLTHTMSKGISILKKLIQNKPAFLAQHSHHIGKHAIWSPELKSMIIMQTIPIRAIIILIQNLQSDNFHSTVIIKVHNLHCGLNKKSKDWLLQLQVRITKMISILSQIGFQASLWVKMSKLLRNWLNLRQDLKIMIQCLIVKIQLLSKVLTIC